MFNLEKKTCQNCPVKSRAIVSRFYEDPVSALGGFSGLPLVINGINKQDGN